MDTSSRAAALRRIDITGLLATRTARAPDHAAENRALAALAEQLAHSPRAVLRGLAQAALDLCQAHSAGISLLEAGHDVFRWHAVVGAWAPFEGGTMPRALSPCATVVARDAAVLLRNPEEHYLIPPEVSPAITEALLIPFHIGGKAVGTLWILAHEEGTHFDAEDERLMRNLGKFAASAYQNLAALEAARRGEARYRALVHSTADRVWRMSADGSLLLETKNRAGGTRAPLPGQMEDWLARYIPAEDHAQVLREWRQALASREVYESTHRALTPDGAHRYWHTRAVPLLDAHGDVAEWIGASVDVTEETLREQDASRRIDELASTVESHSQELGEKEAHLRKALTRRRTAEEAQMTAIQRLISASESERRHISRELHDEVGQQLAALGMGLAQLRQTQPAHAAGKVAALIGETEEISRAVHDLARLLRPQVLDDGGLLPALTNFIDDWSQRTGVPVALDFSALDFRLPGPLETTLYRIVQEGLRNIAKHARATRVSVLLTLRDDELVVIVEDNGAGFDVAARHDAPDGRPTRLGLVGMYERAALCGGELSIESFPGAGTTLHIRVPRPLSTHAQA